MIPEKKRKSEDFILNQRRILQQLKRIAWLAVLPFCFAAVPAAGICLSLPVAVLDVSAAAAVIHFDGNGGSGSMADYTLKDGKGTLPANVFTKKGYVFKGWA
ncbi:MAG: InlB B-repeat-containing protein, partial [Lachnospiraceae bacterium]|nr:InlB B-repeat-containing protein [Lachnospiraceae bacterium]